MTLAEFLGRFSGAVKKVPDGQMAFCPVHEGNGRHKRQSLHISEGGDGTILLKCFAGCDSGAIVQALGLTMADLFASARESRPAPRVSGGVAATFRYLDENGTLRYEIQRLESPNGHKEFRFRRPDGNGGWIYKRDDTVLILYRAPELAAADPTTRVYVAEGEKCADTVRDLGLLGTTAPFGAGKWPLGRGQYEEQLRGRHVVVLRDNDEPGQAHADTVAHALHGIAASLRVVLLPGLPPKGDVVDWKDSAGTREALEQISGEAPAWTPSAAESITLDQELDAVMAASRNSWSWRREGDDFHFTFEDRTRITVSRVRAKRGGIIGMVEVSHPSYGRLDYGPIDVSSRSGMETFRKKLRAKAETLAWEHHLDQVVYTVLTEFQREDPEQPLSDVALTPVVYAMEPLVPLGEPTILVGKRGIGKTTTAYAVGVSWATGISLPGLTPNPGVLGPVGIFDYETTPSAARRQTERIARALGADPDTVMRKIIYRRMTQPLVDVAADIRAMIARRQIQTVIVDSWKPACGVTGAGDPSDSAIAAFGAIRTFNRTVLIVAHPPKDGESVYGSGFNEALVRSLVEVKRLGDPMSLDMNLVLTQTKVNEGRIVPPIGLSFIHEPDPDTPFYPRLVRIGSHELRDEPEAQTSRWAKIRAVFLRDRQMRTVEQLADFTGLGRASVRAELSLHVGEIATASAPGDSRKKLYGLADTRGSKEP